MIKKFFIMLGMLCLSILAIIFLQGRSKYLLEKLKLEIEKKKLKDKADELEKKRQTNLTTINSIDKTDSETKNRIETIITENKKIEEDIEKIKNDISTKDLSINDLMEEIKKL